MESALPEILFDLAAEYDEMLGRGIRLSGEDRHFFVAGRLAELKRRLDRAAAPRRILDFGCGIGDTSRALLQLFGEVEVVGVDTAERALAHAVATHRDPRLRFEALDAFSARGEFDLCYVNGVFHHIRPAERPGAIQRIRDALTPGGHLALFENNPWNPGARMVMRRIPFDRDAQMLSIPESRSLLEAAGFQRLQTRTLFYFPRALAFLRRLEPVLAALPLGAQYLVLGQR
jgi:SAM-dependent methyltransferase